MVGMAIEAASLEQDEIKTGDSVKFVKKYSMRQLLDNDFKLPRDDDEGDLISEELVLVAGMKYDEVG